MSPPYEPMGNPPKNSPGWFVLSENCTRRVKRVTRVRIMDSKWGLNGDNSNRLLRLLEDLQAY